MTTRKQEFCSGVRDEAPISLGVAPFGLIFGTVAINATIAAPAAQVLSSIIFASSSQFITAGMVGTGVSGLAIILVVFKVNLRHALYSASIAPHMRHLSPIWKFLLADLLTDEAYAVTITHYHQDDDPTNKHWYFLGAGLTLWTT